MKILHILFILLFLLALVIPVAFFNATPGEISPIDNAQLPELPAASSVADAGWEATLVQLKTYFRDRLGFRTEMIYFYQTLHDRLFDILIHPLYEYGRDKEVFFEFGYEMEDFDYLALYNAFVGQMQAYCAARDISFYYALTPPKTFIYQEALADGVHYRFRQWKALRTGLDEAGVDVIDLSEPLFAHKAEERMYAVKNDPGHWTEWGAYFGISQILLHLSQQHASLTPLQTDDFSLTETLITTLPVSYFPIEEIHQVLTPRTSEAEEVTYYNENIRVSPIFPMISHYVNDQRPDAPRILVLHGSHFSGAPKYMKDQFSEALFVFSYGTIFDLPYYINLFDPDIVLYEAAAQIISDSHYFDKTLLADTMFQPAATTFDALPEDAFARLADSTDAGPEAIPAAGRGLLTLSWTLDTPVSAAYLRLDTRTLDLESTESETGWSLSVTVDSEAYQQAATRSLLLIDGQGAHRQEIPLEE